ncbi:MAG: 3-dehydroquinate synthase [Lachnospiraceae bacterium]|jgi:3-dehydroquinate synthase|nr:3-dehydroquinate synthase [Lachnospiraceae bacterium]
MSQRLEIMCEKKPAYPILLEDNWNALALELSNLECKDRKICIISDKKVGELYCNDITKIASPISKNVVSYFMENGEKSKSMDTVLDIIDFLLENRFERKDILISLGGGVVGDVTGFVAAIYMRGIDYIQIPTTLLAQADSNMGGKTGIDFGNAKNIIGSFKMPVLVYINTSVLASLDNREYFQGFAEVMKAAIIRDGNMYEWLIENMYEICEKDSAVVMEMLIKALGIKKFYVEKDPSDKSERMVLSLGHTIGHALEVYSDYSLLHGECVALGIVCAAYISWKKSYLSMEEYYEIRDMFVPFYLPISVDNLDVNKVLELTRSDKKMKDGQIRFVLLKKIGKAFVDATVTDEEILAALNEINFTEEDARE